MNVKKTKKFKENRPESYHVHDSDVLHFFCNGSLTDNRAGAATVLFHGGTTDRYKFGCGKKATAYDAEMLVLAAAARQAREMTEEVAATHLPNKGLIHIFFFTDCTSTITDILDPGPHPNQLSSLSFISNIQRIILLFPSIVTNTQTYSSDSPSLPRASCHNKRSFYYPNPIFYSESAR